MLQAVVNWQRAFFGFVATGATTRQLLQNLVGVEKVSAWIDLVRGWGVLLNSFLLYLGSESLWCCRWA
jgi:hypothetical protein